MLGGVAGRGCLLVCNRVCICSLFAVRWALGAGRWALGAGCWALGAGRWALGAGRRGGGALGLRSIAQQCIVRVASAAS